MSKELEKNYSPEQIAGRLYRKWVDNGYLHAEVDGRKKCPVFVTYEKAEDIASSTKYKDYFNRIYGTYIHIESIIY